MVERSVSPREADPIPAWGTKTGCWTVVVRVLWVHAIAGSIPVTLTHGGRSQVVKALDCGSSIREFDPRRSLHLPARGSSDWPPKPDRDRSTRSRETIGSDTCLVVPLVWQSHCLWDDRVRFPYEARMGRSTGCNGASKTPEEGSIPLRPAGEPPLLVIRCERRKAQRLRTLVLQAHSLLTNTGVSVGTGSSLARTHLGVQPSAPPLTVTASTPLWACPTGRGLALQASASEFNSPQVHYRWSNPRGEGASLVWRMRRVRLPWPALPLRGDASVTVVVSRFSKPYRASPTLAACSRWSDRIPSAKKVQTVERERMTVVVATGSSLRVGGSSRTRTRASLETTTQESAR